MAVANHTKHKACPTPTQYNLHSTSVMYTWPTHAPVTHHTKCGFNTHVIQKLRCDISKDLRASCNWKLVQTPPQMIHWKSQILLFLWLRVTKRTHLDFLTGALGTIGFAIEIFLRDIRTARGLLPFRRFHNCCHSCVLREWPWIARMPKSHWLLEPKSSPWLVLHVT